MAVRPLLLLAACVPVLAACSSDDRLVLGRKPGPAAGNGSGTSAAGGSFGNAGGNTARVPDASAAMLAVDIQREAVAVEIVTVQCAGECVDVEAVARGGYPPYAYAWENGSSDPTRRLCPDATQQFSVIATDSGLDSAEFRRAPSTARSSVTAQVLDCSDASSDAGRDAGSDAATGRDGGLPGSDATVPPADCFGPPAREAQCVPLELVECGLGRLVAELPRAIEAGGSACISIVARDPTGAALPAGGFDLSSGADACASSDLLGGQTIGFGNLSFETTFGFCLARNEPLTRISLSQYLDFYGDSLFASVSLCDVCPSQAPP